MRLIFPFDRSVTPQGFWGFSSLGIIRFASGVYGTVTRMPGFGRLKGIRPRSLLFSVLFIHTYGESSYRSHCTTATRALSMGFVLVSELG